MKLIHTGDIEALLFFDKNLPKNEILIETRNGEDQIRIKLEEKDNHAGKEKDKNDG